MRPAAALGAYAAALVVVFGAAVGVGNAVGPVGPVDAPAGPSPAAHAGAPAPGGLAVSQDGFTLRLAQSTLPASDQALLAFTVTGPDGAPLTDYAVSHEEELHLIVVRRDFAGYQHVHPVRADDGTWSVPLDLASPGPYQVFADFTPAGSDESLTLAADLTVPGTYEPVPVPTPADRTSVDGYDIALDGELVAGASSPLTLSISRDGRPVTDLEPYLGAYGHLVALREGDLAYLHVHPDGTGGPGPDVSFTVEVPSAGTYRLFFDYGHGGLIRTAELTASTDTTTSITGSTAGSNGHGSTPHGH